MARRLRRSKRQPVLPEVMDLFARSYLSPETRGVAVVRYDPAFAEFQKEHGEPVTLQDHFARLKAEVLR